MHGKHFCLRKKLQQNLYRLIVYNLYFNKQAKFKQRNRLKKGEKF